MSKTTKIKPRLVRALRACFIDNTLRKRGEKFVTDYPEMKGFFVELTPENESVIDQEFAEHQTLTLKRPPGTTADAKARITGVDEVVAMSDPTLEV